MSCSTCCDSTSDTTHNGQRPAEDPESQVKGGDYPRVISGGGGGGGLIRVNLVGPDPYSKGVGGGSGVHV